MGGITPAFLPGTPLPCSAFRQHAALARTTPCAPPTPLRTIRAAAPPPSPAADFANDSTDHLTARAAAAPRYTPSSFAEPGRVENSHHLANPRRVIHVTRKKAAPATSAIPVPEPSTRPSSSSSSPSPRKIRVLRPNQAAAPTTSPQASNVRPETGLKPAVAAIAEQADIPTVASSVKSAVAAPEPQIQDVAAPAATAAVIAQPPRKEVEEVVETLPRDLTPNVTDPDESKLTLSETLKLGMQAFEFSAVATGACVTSYGTVLVLAAVGSLFGLGG